MRARIPAITIALAFGGQLLTACSLNPPQPAEVGQAAGKTEIGGAVNVSGLPPPPVRVAAAPTNQTTDLDSLYADLDQEEDKAAIADPLESFNRAMFAVNDKFYFHLFKPVVRGYRNVVPEPARVSLSNFFSNLTAPVRFVNCLLQLKIHDALNEFGRFMINTTIGVGGLFDPAKKYAGLEKKEEDFGQTLGVYGFGPGFYLYLPLFGPSNLRDSAGLLADYAVDMRAYIDDNETIAELFFFEQINRLSLDKDTYEAIKKESLDPYVAIRSAYTQYREAKIRE